MNNHHFIGKLTHDENISGSSLPGLGDVFFFTVLKSKLLEDWAKDGRSFRETSGPNFYISICLNLMPDIKWMIMDN